MTISIKFMLDFQQIEIKYNKMENKCNNGEINT
jgi:hypothetical protein